MPTPLQPDDTLASPHRGRSAATWQRRDEATGHPCDTTLHEAASIPDTGPTRAFGHTLEPALRRACDGRLGAVTWFRADWQRGGALTGYAQFQDDHGVPQPVVVKLPVPPCERYWLTALQAHDDVAPRLFAHGEAVNGYDLAWVVMERLGHGPLGGAWAGAEFDLICQAAARFHAAAHHYPLIGEPVHKDWAAIFERSRRQVHDGSLAHAQRWNSALKKTHRRLKPWIARWRDRPCRDWCHGDLHLANAMTRQPAPAGPALLFDFARTHIGHWIEDAVYLEHLFWARRDRLNGRRLCSLIAHERRANGLAVEDDWSRYADLKRALLAMATPAMLRHDGDPRHVHAALQVLERAVG